MFNRKTRLTLTQTRKTMRRLDMWAENAARMLDTGNMVMFTAYVDRIQAGLSLLQDTGIMTAEDAAVLLDEYTDFWSDVTGEEAVKSWL